ncbi:cubilin-like isoform X2 [Physella acuta]|uniref:cubilin-like isoform X2 n=1 Tax=Physella acuta TaxID=109671 RepID=UPI0027DB9ADF|nr:cubilin-like isoform X2 [Physella acuta]
MAWLSTFYLVSVLCLGLQGQDHVMLVENCNWPREQLVKQNISVKIPESLRQSLVPRLTCQTRLLAYTTYSPLHLRVVRFNLSGSGICSSKSERVTLDMGENYGYRNISWCGQTFAYDLQLSVFELTLTYYTGENGAGSGFEIEFSQGDRTQAQDVQCTRLPVAVEPRLLYSPNYPDNYQSSVRKLYCLEAASNYYIHVHSREMNLELGCGYDFLNISNSIFCGRQDIDIILPTSFASFKFQSDGNKEYPGYILEYQAINATTLTCAYNRTVTATDIETVLYLVNMTQRCAVVVDSGSDDKVLSLNLNNPQHMDIFIDNKKILLEAKHMLTPGRQVFIQVSPAWFQDTALTWFMTVQAVNTNFVPALAGNSSLVWLSGNLMREQVRIQSFADLQLQVFSLTGVSATQVKPMTVSEYLAVYQGPDSSYFELTSDCNGDILMSDKVQSLRSLIEKIAGTTAQEQDGILTTEYLTITFRKKSEDGIWLYITEADSPWQPKTKFPGEDIAFNSRFMSNVKTKNLYCSWEVKVTKEIVQITADSNFAPFQLGRHNSFLVEQVVNSASAVLARFDQFDKPSQKIVYSQLPVVIHVVVVQDVEPRFEFRCYQDYLSNIKQCLDFGTFSTNTSKVVVSTPNYPSFYLSDCHCSWTIRRDVTQYTATVIEFPEITYNMCGQGVNTGPLTISTSNSGKDFTSAAEICQTGSFTQTFTDKFVRVDFTAEHQVKPGFQFYFSHQVTAYTCGSKIVLQEGQNYTMVFPASGLTSPDCHFYLYPASYDSHIRLAIEDVVYPFNFVEVNASGKIEKFVSSDFTDQQPFPVIYKQTAVQVHLHLEHLLAHNYALNATMARICGLDLDVYSYAATLTSPQYPDLYPLNKVCKWHMRAASGTIFLDFIEFSLEPTLNFVQCSKDYLEIYDGPLASQTLIGRYCGDISYLQVESQTSEMTLIFVSDGTVNKPGFRLLYRAMTATTESPVSESSGSYIVGIVIGCIVFVLVLIAVMVILIRRRRWKNRTCRQGTAAVTVVNSRESAVFILSPVPLAPPPYSMDASPPPYSQANVDRYDEYEELDDPPPYSEDLQPGLTNRDVNEPEVNDGRRDASTYVSGLYASTQHPPLYENIHRLNVHVPQPATHVPQPATHVPQPQVLGPL